MSDLNIKDKNILLAKHFGWQFTSSEQYDLIITSPDGFEVEWAKANGRTMQQVLDDSWYVIPRYFEDSAAIRKAKLSLTSEQRGYFIDHLANICRENSDGPATSIGKAFFATCEQEAEALGLTLNLWSGGFFEQNR